MSDLYIKFDDAKEVIKNILEQFYGLKEDTYENEFENTVTYLFQELEQKCFHLDSEAMTNEERIDRLEKIILILAIGGIPNPKYAYEYGLSHDQVQEAMDDLKEIRKEHDNE